MGSKFPKIVTHIPVRQFVKDLSSGCTEAAEGEIGLVRIFILKVLRIRIVDYRLQLP
jgi:hypothetical protein